MIRASYPSKPQIETAGTKKVQPRSWGLRDVIFLGAGPGDPELMTVKGMRALECADVILYAGSLVPQAVIDMYRSEQCVVHNTASQTLDHMIAIMVAAVNEGKRVVRVHSGDLSLYSAINEQIHALQEHNITTTWIPGVPAVSAAVASFQTTLTIPNIAQSVVLTRSSLRSSSMPMGESLESYAASGATIVLYLGIAHLALVRRSLIPILKEDCPVLVGYRLGWPDEVRIRSTLGGISVLVKRCGITRGALLIVGKALAHQNQYVSNRTADQCDEKSEKSVEKYTAEISVTKKSAAAKLMRSALYNPDYGNLFRPKKKPQS